jgi:hypothetical protein
VSHIEEFMAGHVGVMELIKRERNYKREYGGTEWKLEAKGAFSFPGD